MAAPEILAQAREAEGGVRDYEEEIVRLRIGLFKEQ